MSKKGEVYLKVFIGNDHSRDIHIPIWRLWAGTTIAVLLLVFGLAGIGGVIYGISAEATKQTLMAKYRDAEAKAGRVAEAEQKLAEAIAKEREIRLILGLPVKPEGYENLPRGGYIETQSPETWQLERLLSLAQQEAEDLARLEKELKARISEQREMPCIAPAAGTITSGFGYRRDPVYGGWRFHSGLDIAGPPGTPIIATAGGTVISAGWDKGYGLAVEIDHGNGVTTYYAHCSRLAVSPGMQVKRGDVIAYTGATGKTTGPHLHYEVRVNGVPRNPEKYILVSDTEYD
ncbi:MAG: peptidoglycan DD-metalloendopeptidase family protein [candidate division WOR-3 bacterium]